MFNFVCNYKVNPFPSPCQMMHLEKKKKILYLGKYGTSAKGDGGD